MKKNRKKLAQVKNSPYLCIVKQNNSTLIYCFMNKYCIVRLSSDDNRYRRCSEVYSSKKSAVAHARYYIERLSSAKSVWVVRCDTNGDWCKLHIAPDVMNPAVCQPVAHIVVASSVRFV